MLKTHHIHLRPWAQFDPANKSHRSYFNEFLKTRSWKNCPVQWTIGDDSQDVVHYINKVLLNYYTALEFTSKKSKTVVKKQQNSPKVADKKIVRLKSM